MIVTTTENIPEARVVKTLGQVFGLTVRSRSLGGNIAAFLKSLVGGEVRSYVKLNEDARRQALDRMVQNAAAMGANAVTMMRFDSTEMGRSMSEIVAYGTARVVEWLPKRPTLPARRPESAPMGVAVWVYRGNRGRWGRGCAVRLGPLPKQRAKVSASHLNPPARSSPTPRRVSRCACWYNPATGEREYRPE